MSAYTYFYFVAKTLCEDWVGFTNVVRADAWVVRLGCAGKESSWTTKKKKFHTRFTGLKGGVGRPFTPIVLYLRPPTYVVESVRMKTMQVNVQVIAIDFLGLLEEKKSEIPWIVNQNWIQNIMAIEKSRKRHGIICICFTTTTTVLLWFNHTLSLDDISAKLIHKIFGG